MYKNCDNQSWSLHTLHFLEVHNVKLFIMVSQIVVILTPFLRETYTVLVIISSF